MEKVRDMTKGNPVRHIIAFSVPILLGNMFQQLYTLVDTAVVGKVCGVAALAAVGSASWLDWLVLGFVIGLTQGFSILISQRFGAGDMKGMRCAITMSAYLTMASIAVVTTLSLSLCTTAIRWMNTPVESFDLACQYVQMIFLGIPVTMCYNLFAGILRAVGNSRTPLVAMVVAALTNIVLDIVFVSEFSMGVRGAALATVMSQALSAVVCLVAVLRVEMLKLHREDWNLDRCTIRTLFRLGFPIAGQNTIVSVGGVVLQGIMNGFGVVFMAGISAASKLCGLFEMAGLSISSAMHTFAGQNLGAGRYDRIRDGVKKTILVAIAISVGCGIIGLIFGREMLTMFVDMNAENAGEVLDAAYNYFAMVCVTLFTLYMLFILRSTLQGMGDVVFPITSSFVQVFFRTVVAFVLSKLFGVIGVYLGDMLAWSSAGMFLVVVYLWRINKLDPKGRRKAAA